MKCFAIHSNCSVLIHVFKKMALCCQERLFPSACTCKSSLRNTGNKIKSISFFACAAHPVQKLCMQNCWRTCFHCSQNNVQEIAQLGFKGTRRCWVSVVHMLLQGLKWNYKFKKSHLNFPLLWAVRSFCAGPLQGGRWIRREGTGSFKVWHNEMAPTQKDGWESFCKHFVGGLTIM